MQKRLTEILGLPADASEAEILKEVSALVNTKAAANTAAAFEARLGNLINITHMERGEAIRCLTEQDRAARATPKTT